MGIFKRKVGGTLVGNLLRGVVNTATKGVLGNGALMLQPPPDAMDTSLQNAKQVIAEVPAVKQAIAQGIWAKYKFAIIGAVVALGGLITWLAMRNKKGGRKRF